MIAFCSVHIIVFIIVSRKNNNCWELQLIQAPVGIDRSFSTDMELLVQGYMEIRQTYTANLTDFKEALMIIQKVLVACLMEESSAKVTEI